MQDQQRHSIDERSGSLVEVWFKIEKDADGYPESKSWEGLWAEKVDGAYVLISVPFYLKNVSSGDAVEACEREFLAFTRVINRGGHNTYRLLIPQESRSKIDETVYELISLGLAVEKEITMLLAVDVPPSVDQAEIDSFLAEGSEAGRWEMQDGFLSSNVTSAGGWPISAH